MPDFETCPPAARKRYDTVSMFFLGMVNVGVGEARISVRWSVNDFDSRSLDAVIAFLMRQSEPKPVLIEYHFGGWEQRMVDSPLEAAAILENAKQLKPTSPIVKPFVRQMDLGEIEAARPLVRRGFRAWQASDARFTMEPEKPWRSFLKRTLVFDQDDRNGRMVYRHLGRDAALIRVKGRTWAESVLGKSCGRALQETPAGGVLSDVYDEVMRRFEPRFDHIRACIPRADGEIEWVPYQRLLMPVLTTEGKPALVWLSVTTPEIRISIPVQTA